MDEHEKWELIRSGGVILDWKPLNQDEKGGRFMSEPCLNFARDVLFEDEDGNSLCMSLERVMALMGIDLHKDFVWVEPNNLPNIKE